MERGYLEQMVKISAGRAFLDGELTIPVNPKGLIMFSHASGKNGVPLRSRLVSQVLNKEGFATLNIDLLTRNEEKGIPDQKFFDLLCDRLESVTNWALANDELNELEFAYFGTGVGLAVALTVSVRFQDKIRCVAGRGGRVAFAQDCLSGFQIPVLFLVAEKDEAGVAENFNAFEKIPGKKDFKVITGATHFFNEIGKLGEVAHVASLWFSKNLPVSQGGSKRSEI